MDRDGSLSSFPGSLDQFKIKKSYNKDIALNLQHEDALERAAHFNHMFDAVYKIQQHLYRKIGYPLVTRNSTATGDQIARFEYASMTIPVSGTSATASGSLPSGMSFYSNTFSVGHNVYCGFPGGSSLTEGIWANHNWGNFGPSNDMMAWAQYFVSIAPLSSSTFNLTVTKLPIHGTGSGSTGSFVDTFQIAQGSTIPIYNRPGWKFSGYLNAITISREQWAPYSGILNYVPQIKLVSGAQFPNQRSGGWAYPLGLPDFTDASITFSALYTASYPIVDAGYVFSRGGVMLRATGAVSGATFYCISFGDVKNNEGAVASNRRLYGRILKVENANLIVGLVGDASGYSWGASGGTVTDLGSAFFYFGDTTKRYRFKVVGSDLTVESASSPFTSWSTLYGPFTDTVSPLVSGKVGLFVKSFGWFYPQTIAELRNEISIQSLDTIVPLDVEVQLFYMDFTDNSGLE